MVSWKFMEPRNNNWNESEWTQKSGMGVWTEKNKELIYLYFLLIITEIFPSVQKHDI